PPSLLNMLLSRHTKRREFIAALGGAALCPAVVLAQQPNQMRRIGIIMNVDESDREGQVRLPRLAHLMHQPFAGSVLSIHQL
ncbi:MAG TPA: hypothetical protein VIU42_15185, partial [Xanthobacteraceae bacterium]